MLCSISHTYFLHSAHGPPFRNKRDAICKLHTQTSLSCFLPHTHALSSPFALIFFLFPFLVAFSWFCVEYAFNLVSSSFLFLFLLHTFFLTFCTHYTLTRVALYSPRVFVILLFSFLRLFCVQETSLGRVCNIIERAVASSVGCDL